MYSLCTVTGDTFKRNDLQKVIEKWKFAIKSNKCAGWNIGGHDWNSLGSAKLIIAKNIAIWLDRVRIRSIEWIFGLNIVGYVEIGRRRGRGAYGAHISTRQGE